MNTNKAAYWIALGALALGLNSEYSHGNFVVLHRIADRADFALCRITTRAEQTLAVAKLLMSRDPNPADGLLASAGEVGEPAWEQTEADRDELRDNVREQVRDQAEILREGVRDEIEAQADSIRAQVEMRRADIEQIRIRTRSQFSLPRAVSRPTSVACPKMGIWVVVNAEPADRSAEVEDAF